MAAVSDKKVGFSSNGTTIDYYKAEVVSTQDYYPFGMMMPGRKYSIANTNYRYGFNGKENDNEVKGYGNQISYENRIYDPRLARWYSLDPLQKKYPGESNYSFVSNSPLLFADKDGRDKIVLFNTINKDGTTTVIKRVIDDSYFKYSKNPSYGGRYQYYKQDLVLNLTIDNRKEGNITIDQVIKDPTLVQFSSGYTNDQEIGRFEYYTRWLPWFNLEIFSTGDESGKVRDGWIVYGQGRDMEWQNGLPTAGVGSESIDLGSFLNFIGGLREGVTLSELVKGRKLENVLKKLETTKIAIDKAFDAIDNIKTREIPDSAVCPSCTQKQNRKHINEVPGQKGKFEELEKLGQTDKTKRNGN